MCESRLRQDTVVLCSKMASANGERHTSLHKFLYIDALATMYEQLELDGKDHEADVMGDFLDKVGRGHFPWMLPMGPHPGMETWMRQMAERERGTRTRGGYGSPLVRRGQTETS